MVRLFRKAYNTLKQYGVTEVVRRSYIYFDRKATPSKYFHILKRRSKNASVLFISGEPKNATSFYRCEIPKYQLEHVGIETDIVHEDFLKPDLAKEYKYIIFYRTPLHAGNKKILDIAKQRGIKTIFSIDDFVYRRDLLEDLDYTKYLDTQDSQRLLQRADGMLKLMQKCDAGVSSTDYLAKDMRKYIKGEVLVHRNGYKQLYDSLVSDSHLTPENHKLVLGYFSGSETHDRDLNLIWPVLTRALTENKDTELWVGGRINFDFGQYACRVKRMPFMNRDDYMRLHSKVDINLLPLEDTEFNRGKSEIKFLEAALVGVPTVISAVGDLGNVIGQVNQDLVARNEGEWYDKLVKLMRDKDLRIDLAKSAKGYVLANYKPEKLGKELKQFLEKI